MRRKYLTQCLTTFLPTILLCVVSLATHWFKLEYFEANVTVNLTALLVIASLFISVFESLPRTSYIKMIDIWLIATIVVPFVQVILQTWLDAQRKHLDQLESECNKVTLFGGFSSRLSEETYRSIKNLYQLLLLISGQKDDKMGHLERIKDKNMNKQQVMVKRTRIWLRILEGFGSFGLPTTFVVFAFSYFIIGTLKTASNPDIPGFENSNFTLIKIDQTV